MRHVFVLLNVVLVLAGAPRAVAQDGTPSAASGNFAGLVDVGGRSLWLVCRGSGSPTVVLEQGTPTPGAATVWGPVWRHLAEFTRVCFYDRAGIGASDPAPTPRTVRQMADDLHALLHAAGVPGPYVLVAHSFGPLISRLYASTYPDEVAGLVLIDGLHEDAEARFKEIVPPDLRERWIEDFWGGNPEGIALEESFAQVRNAGPLPTVPLIVLVHGDVHFDPSLYPSTWPVEVVDAVDRIWKELVATQATLVPGGRLVVAEQSGHLIMEAQPALVIEAVRQVVEAARDPSRWATPQASPVA